MEMGKMQSVAEADEQEPGEKVGQVGPNHWSGGGSQAVLRPRERVPNRQGYCAIKLRIY